MQGSPIFLDARDGVAISHAEMPLDSPCQNSLATASGTIFVLLGLTLPARRSTTLMYGISPILISEEDFHVLRELKLYRHRLSLQENAF